MAENGFVILDKLLEVTQSLIDVRDLEPCVCDQFGRGQRLDEKVNLLLDYIRRNATEAARLDALLEKSQSDNTLT